MIHSKYSLTRRQFVAGSLQMLGAAPFLNLTPVQTTELVVERTDVAVAELPLEFNNFRIGFLTDIHLSAFLTAGLLESAIEVLKRAELDLLLLGGDYLWAPRSSFRTAFPVYRKELGDLNDPLLAKIIYQQLLEQIVEIPTREGICAVVGNHDRWIAPADFFRAFAHSPIQLLVNQSRIFTRGDAHIELVGTDDYVTGQPRLTALDRSSAQPHAKILLTHNPDLLNWYLHHSTQRYSLALMGHTHGGQICPYPGMAFSYNIKNRAMGAGWFTHHSGCQCYTSRGLGCVGIPYRLNCPPEVTILTIVRPPDELVRAAQQ